MKPPKLTDLNSVKASTAKIICYTNMYFICKLLFLSSFSSLILFLI